MKKRLVEILIFLVTVIMMGLVGGLYSLIFAGVAGGAALGFAPKFSLGLVEKYVCPEGTHFQYGNGQDSAASIFDSSSSLNCAGQDGTVIQGVKTRAASSVFGMYFLLCFVPTYIPGAILLWIFLNREVPRFFDEDTVPIEND